MFGTFEVLAGDFVKKSQAQFVGGTFHISVEGKFFRETIGFDQLQEIEIASEENVKKMAGAVGLGLVGGLLLGGVGLAAGLLAGGSKKELVVICSFKDGRKLMAKMDNKIFTEIQALRF